MRKWAVIPTGNREEDYLSVIDWCKNHNIKTVTIATSTEAKEYSEGKVIFSNVLNISKWWNLGLEYIAEKEFYNDDDYLVAILNDDAVLPDNWIEEMEEAIESGVSGAGTPRGLGSQKIAGWAFALNGRHDMRLDEKLVWWYGDDDIQRQCEEESGFKLIHGLSIGNKYANSSYDFMREQIEKDEAYYNQKWGL